MGGLCYNTLPLELDDLIIQVVINLCACCHSDRRAASQPEVEESVQNGFFDFATLRSK